MAILLNLVKDEQCANIYNIDDDDHHSCNHNDSEDKSDTIVNLDHSSKVDNNCIDDNTSNCDNSNVFFLIQVSDAWPQDGSRLGAKKKRVVGDKVRERRDASVDGLNHIRAYLAEQERLQSD